MMTSPREAAATRSEVLLRSPIAVASIDTHDSCDVAPPSDVKDESTMMRSQTCVEFLHIMKEFSESSCNASETVQRVDSLVSQDKQLLRLFPLERSQEEEDATKRLQRTLEDENEESIARIACESDKNIETQDELQRWMDLDLDDLDHHMDVFDFQQPLVLNEKLESASSSIASTPCGPIVPPTASPFMKRGTDGYLHKKTSHWSANDTVKSTKEKGQDQTVPFVSSEDKNSLDKTALFDYDNEELDLVLGNAVSNRPLKRAKLSKATSALELRVAVSTEEMKAETDDESKADEDEEGNVWGMENDAYEHDLLASIDHAVLCDRENRFLQWDLEATAQKDLKRLQEVVSPGPLPTGTNSVTSGLTAIETHGSVPSNDKVMASSPLSSKSPSNVDIVEDWNSLDFGTFQNRTVSHILSSCLHKRKLHHPYKNQVQLVNFNVPGSSDSTLLAGACSHSHQLGGSLATSLAFGGQSHATDGTSDSPLSGFVPLLATGHDNSVNSKSLGKGEKKMPKKREERKRLMSLKMQETFADLESTFTEQDLDVKGIVGPGASLSKMALSKLENLPLPDLLNLPQDLRELKRKIEATEHKVEGTKHRHRKGGPCPRCQVQNQLRAAKRAYHKRAVAHKKLPHVVVNAVNDEAQEAANADARSGGSSRVKARATLAGMSSLSTGLLKRPATSVSLSANSSMMTAVLGGSTSGSSSSSSCSSVSLASSSASVRGPCGKAALPFSSPSSASSPASASNPSSPETASPQLHHVTVSSN